jgi:cytochrome c oxidase accessory protein FixG
VPRAHGLVPRLIGPRRRLFQWGATLTVLTIPFVRIGGESLLRIDLPALTLYLGGRTFAVEELYFFLLATIALVLLFLLATLALGRAWCGWACPQTTLTDLTEWFARSIGGKVGGGTLSLKGWQKGALHLFCGAMALLVAANLLWYFISPYDFFGMAAEGLPPAALWMLAVTAAAVYLDLTFMRRLVCREFCPYGRFQSALVDAGTLTLRFHPDEARRCIGCGACVRACPTGIDIRCGFQIECINCGRCLDACRTVMGQREQSGIIRYTFGVEGRGPRALLNPRMLLLASLLLALCIVAALALASRETAILKVGRPAAAPARILADGRTVNLFTAVVGNRQRRDVTVSLFALDGQGEDLEVLGPVGEIFLVPGERRSIDFSVLLPPGAGAGPMILQLRDREGTLLVEADAHLLVPLP